MIYFGGNFMMNSLKIITICLTLIIFGACGKKTKTSTDKKIADAQAKIDDKKYENAVDILEELLIKIPENEKIMIKLAHAYAGASGFEAEPFMNLLKTLEKRTVEKSATSILKGLEQFLVGVPVLSSQQVERLNQAINLYGQSGLDPQTTTKENNFKWGVLHVYRLMITIRDTVTRLQEIIRVDGTDDLSSVESYLFKQGDLIAQDSFQAYSLFKNSYNKLALISEKLETLINSTVKDDNFKIKINSMASDYKVFISDLISENTDLISRLIVDANDRLKILKSDLYKNEIDTIATRIRNDEADLKNQGKHIKIIVKMFIENVMLKNPRQTEEIKAIFTKEFIAETKQVINQSVIEQSLQPIKDFIQSPNSKIQTIKEALAILDKEYSSSGLDDIMKNDVKMLASYIKKEELKSIQVKINAAEDDIIMQTQPEINNQLHKNRNEIIERISEDKKQLDSEYGQYVDDLNEALHSTDPEMNQNSKRIINDVRNEIEN